ncbi:MAG: ATP-binding protein [Desulfovibrio sp.]|uniref:PAS domain-containing sensor histidine kinase n=1 Tax=Desulfovibrio sp. 7SRBS1 TaxID=3378064 RepID=UPI003B3E2EBD
MLKPLHGACICLGCFHTPDRQALADLFTEAGAGVTVPDHMVDVLNFLKDGCCHLLVADLEDLRGNAENFFALEAPDVPVLAVVATEGNLVTALDLGADEVCLRGADSRLLVHRAQALTHRCACHSGHVICRRFEEERLKHVLKNMPVLVYACDDDGSIVFFNPEFERITGFSAPEVLDNPEAMSLIAPDDSRFVAACPVDVSKTGAPHPEWAFRNKHGNDRVVLWSHMAESCPIRGWNRWAVGVDVTDYSRLEMLRREVERTVQHDLRNPLNAIFGFSTLLLEDDDLSPNARDFISRIQECSRRMVRIIKSSLSLFRLEQGEGTLRPVRVELAPLLQSLCEEAGATARSAGVEVKLEYSGATGAAGVTGAAGDVAVLGEGPLLETLFANLVQNAVEASQKGQMVEVCLASGNPVRVTVHNQGVISEAVRENFFERYVSGKPGGTGMGTYLAKRIARLHNGDVDFVSDAEHGTTLTVTLPAAD